ncbi:hypothetical protein MPNT_50142 [Candidatus Methylacidithermus pantelleriae]|uniref:Uncharacterized protein n=1 Tax=Candidatus Methylacidithermus pantelleriae TaxID=2744239 RepID=A0A8J2FPH5_9BACT|nr:hypothetical protein MPNT_50142 [Candidatus Methylacidithermus pantelleriae]
MTWPRDTAAIRDPKRLADRACQSPDGPFRMGMIVPMLGKIDFRALREVAGHYRGLGVTLLMNWAIKPFSMAALAWLFVGHGFRPW